MKTQMTTNKANAAIATNYHKAEELAAAARHAASQAKDGNAELSAAAVTADAELAKARAAYWEIKPTATTTKKIKLKLAGLDGNAFSLMGEFLRQARKEGWTKDETKKVMTECQSGDYNNLLRTLMAHCR